MNAPDQTPSRDPEIGVVVIGRNEGERLVRCLASVTAAGRPVVYVDSGSTDGSVEAARTAGAEVVQLDLSVPFTAARARNAGFRRMCEIADATYVQFIDGDCEMQPGWLSAARAFLDAHPEVAVVCGRRRERFPEASVYNRLCDREWDTPVGEARACGGDALMRLAAFRAVDGFRDGLIAGEEPELCVRLRAAGWRIWRLDEEMTLHDAAMTRLGQWWNRNRRAGHAYAEGAALHGCAPFCHGVPGTLRALAWGAALPLAALGMGVAHPLGLALLLAYPAQVWRLALRGGSGRAAWEIAFFTVLGKFPEMLGVMTYLVRRLRRGPARLIEYK